MGYGILPHYINAIQGNQALSGPGSFIFSAGFDKYTLRQAFPASVGGRPCALWLNGNTLPIPGPVPSPTLRQATAHAVMNPDGTIAIIQVDNPGFGYLALPIVTVVPPPVPVQMDVDVTINGLGSLDIMQIVNVGYGYFVAPPLTVDPPPGPGVQMLLHVTVANGRMTAVFNDNPGAGYAIPPAAAPNVFIPPALAGIQEVITGVSIDPLGQVTAIAISGVGTGYDPLNPPFIFISAPP